MGKIIEMTVNVHFDTKDEYTLSGEEIQMLATDISMTVARLAIIATNFEVLSNEMGLLAKLLLNTVGRIDESLPEQILGNAQDIGRQLLDIAEQAISAEMMN